MGALVMAGTHSGCGKTTITIGLLSALAKKGLTVQPFKAGPDFIDAGLHARGAGRRSRNLDLWMCGGDFVRRAFARHSAGADVSVVEGVMGLYDGDNSTAALAAALGLPVVLVVDAFGMAESAGAVVAGFDAHGQADSRTGGRLEGRAESQTGNRARGGVSSGVSGVIFNRAASENHFKRLKSSVRDIPVLGYLPADNAWRIPHRHLGLATAGEDPLSGEALEKLSEAVSRHIDLDLLINIAGGAKPAGAQSGAQSERARKPDGIAQEAEINAETRPARSHISGPPAAWTIAVASDRAFCFYYEDNLDLLAGEGARIVRFSPLDDPEIPDAQAVYFGGGYPELYAEKLSKNTPFLESLRRAADGGMPIYAECGGLMYLSQGIRCFDGGVFPMAGIFPFGTVMRQKRSSLGYREVTLKRDCLIGPRGAVLRGHEFHYSDVEDALDATSGGFSDTPAYAVTDGRGAPLKDEGFVSKNVLASYVHLHFGSNPSAASHVAAHAKGVYRQ